MVSKSMSLVYISPASLMTKRVEPLALMFLAMKAPRSGRGMLRLKSAGSPESVKRIVSPASFIM